MEPLTLTFGVIGLLQTVAHVSKILVTFTKGVVGAPESANIVLSEVNDIETLLKNLQQFLNGAIIIDQTRARLAKVDGILAILTSMVTTFSDLTEILDRLETKGMDTIDRVKWARKEKNIMEVLQRLEKSKSSMTVMLGVFQR